MSELIRPDIFNMCCLLCVYNISMTLFRWRLNLLRRGPQARGQQSRQSVRARHPGAPLQAPWVQPWKTVTVTGHIKILREKNPITTSRDT